MARRRGTAASLHAAAVDWTSRSVTWCDATAPAVVLGSTQPDSAVVPGAGGLDVVRRRSGGGAVLVEPGRVVWADVVVPAGDRLWDDDVGRAAWWLGEAWVRALAAVGVGGGTVHRGGLVRSSRSSQVCFAGLGPGEVTVGGRKVVGVSQRRTRHGALFQCAVPLAWDPLPLLGALDLTPAERAESAAVLVDAVADLPVPPAALEVALVDELP